MAEEAKTEFRAVDVSLDAEGNPVVKPIEAPAAEQEEETQEEETQEEESQEEESSEESSEEEESTEEEEESQEEESEEESEDESEEETEENTEEETEEEETEDVQTQDDEDVVDYDELPEAVQKYLDFYEETGGSMQDFMQINRDFDSIPQDDVIREYLRKQNPYLDEADIEYEMESQFGINEEDSDAEVRAKKVAKKKFYGQAINALKADADKYKADLGSSGSLPAQAQEAIQFKKSYEAQQAEAAKQQKAVQARVNSFVNSSKKALGKDFKGFEVKVGDESYTYKPSNITKTRDENLNVNNLLGKFTDKEGNVTDVVGYHKALTFASNPDAVAAHFIEIGKALQAEADAKGSKNVQTKPRQTHSKKDNSKAKFKFVDVDSSMSKNAKIKLRNY